MNENNQKPMGIIITNLEEVKKFDTLEDYILCTFYGRDLSETMENTALGYFLDNSVANEIYPHFKKEIMQRSLGWEETTQMINDKIEKGIIREEEAAEALNIQMTIDAISDICGEIYCDEKRVDNNPNMLLDDIFKENTSENGRGDR